MRSSGPLFFGATQCSDEVCVIFKTIAATHPVGFYLTMLVGHGTLATFQGELEVNTHNLSCPGPHHNFRDKWIPKLRVYIELIANAFQTIPLLSIAVISYGTAERSGGEPFGWSRPSTMSNICMGKNRWIKIRENFCSHSKWRETFRTKYRRFFPVFKILFARQGIRTHRRAEKIISKAREANSDIQPGGVTTWGGLLATSGDHSQLANKEFEFKKFKNSEIISGAGENRKKNRNLTTSNTQ